MFGGQKRCQIPTENGYAKSGDNYAVCMETGREKPGAVFLRNFTSSEKGPRFRFKVTSLSCPKTVQVTIIVSTKSRIMG